MPPSSAGQREHSRGHIGRGNADVRTTSRKRVCEVPGSGRDVGDDSVWRYCRRRHVDHLRLPALVHPERKDTREVVVPWRDEVEHRRHVRLPDRGIAQVALHVEVAQ